MYVFHMPLAVLIWNGLGVRSGPAFAVFLLLGVVGMGELTERRTHWYRARLAPLFVRKPAPVHTRYPAAPGGMADPLCDAADERSVP